MPGLLRGVARTAVIAGTATPSPTASAAGRRTAGRSRTPSSTSSRRSSTRLPRRPRSRRRRGPRRAAQGPRFAEGAGSPDGRGVRAREGPHPGRLSRAGRARPEESSAGPVREEQQGGLDAPADLRGAREAELGEDRVGVLLDLARFDSCSDSAIAALLFPCAISASTARSRELSAASSPSPRRLCRDEHLDELRIDHRAARGHRLERAGQLLEVVHPLLEQVGPAVRARLEQREHVARVASTGSARRRPARDGTPAAPQRLGSPRRCSSAACGCRSSRRPARALVTASSSSSRSPQAATTSMPARVASISRSPSRTMKLSSPRTTRIIDGIYAHPGTRSAFGARSRTVRERWAVPGSTLASESRRPREHGCAQTVPPS